MASLPLGLLPTLLRNHAAGVYAAEAAVELLARHGIWLTRSDFTTACVSYDPDRRVAWVDWPAVPEFLQNVGCSSSEDRILRFAVELAGQDSGSPLPELLSGLDDTQSRLIVDALRHALGARPGVMIPCECGFRIPAVAYTTHRQSPRHAGPDGACVCGQSTPHPIGLACTGREASS